MFERLKKLAQRVGCNTNAQKSKRPRSAIVGEWGEKVAVNHLLAKGFKILGCNVRPAHHDEIDIIALKENLLVFVEVKARKSADIARPMLAVNKRKRHALNRAAAAWLRKVGYPNYFYRFDVIEVIGQPESEQIEIHHIEDAFPFEKRFMFPVYVRK